MEAKHAKDSSVGSTRPLHCNESIVSEEEESPRVVSSTTTTTELFFREQGDMVSEILSFLDLRSLLTMCSTHKKAVSCLRYEHVVSSALKKQSTPSDHHMTRIMDRNAILILNKLVSVYDLEGGSTTTRNHGNHSAAKITTQWRKSTKPSPLRLLRLVNGRKCERCYRDLISPCVWAGTGSSEFALGCGGSNSNKSSGTIVLPSISFGEFCCTQCIFDTTRFLSPLPLRLASKQKY